MTNQKKIVIFAFAVGSGLFLAYVVRETLLLIYISIVFAVVLSPAVEWAHRVSIGSWHPSRGVALLLLLAAVIGLLVAFLLFAIPPIVADIQDMAKKIPDELRKLKDRFAGLPLASQLDLQNLQRLA